MERVIVTFDVFIPDEKLSTHLVKLWNEVETAANYVKNYIDKRNDLVWGYMDQEALVNYAPGAVIEFHGYSDETKTVCQDMITVYHVEAEDPDDDPMKRILRTLIPDLQKEAQENTEEAPYYKYAAECFQRMLDDINEIEQKNLEKKGEVK